MNKKIAIPVDENGILEGHFGHCKFFEFFDTVDNQIISKVKLVPPPHEPGVLPKWLGNHGVTDVIAGGMGDGAIKILTHFAINIYKGAPKLVSDELVIAFLNNTLELSDNSCNHDHHDHSREHQHNHHNE